MRRAILIAVLAVAAVAVLLTVSNLGPQRGPRGAVGTPLTGVAPHDGDSNLEPAAGGLGADLTPEQVRELERIATLGYIAGVEPVPEETGVVRHVADSTYGGCTLYTCAEGTEAFLIDMDGRTVFRWSSAGAEYWARARPFPAETFSS